MRLSSRLLLSIFEGLLTLELLRRLTTRQNIVPLGPDMTTLQATNREYQGRFRALQLLTGQRSIAHARQMQEGIRSITIRAGVTIQGRLTNDYAHQNSARTMGGIIRATFRRLRRILTHSTTRANHLVMHTYRLLLRRAMHVLNFLFFTRLHTMLQRFLTLAHRAILSKEGITLFRRLIHAMGDFTRLSNSLQF